MTFLLLPLLLLTAATTPKVDCKSLVQEDYDKAALVVQATQRYRHPQEGDDQGTMLNNLELLEYDWWETHKQVMKHCPNYPRPPRKHDAQDAGAPDSGV